MRLDLDIYATINAAVNVYLEKKHQQNYFDDFNHDAAATSTSHVVYAPMVM